MLAKSNGALNSGPLKSFPWIFFLFLGTCLNFVLYVQSLPTPSSSALYNTRDIFFILYFFNPSNSFSGFLVFLNFFPSTSGRRHQFSGIIVTSRASFFIKQKTLLAHSIFSSQYSLNFFIFFT